MLKKIFIAVFLFTVLGFAQEKTDNVNDSDSSQQSNFLFFNYIKKLTVKDYYSLLDKLKSDDTTDFFLLRMAYTKTDSYEPYNSKDDESIKNCEKLLDGKKYKESLEPLDSILNRNYVNIKAHMYLGYIYKKMNKEDKSYYHYRVYEGLTNSFLETGNGKDVNNAYIVINVKEEYLLLDRLGLKMQSQRLVEEGGHAYDVLTVKEGNKSKPFDVYFNIDLPLKTLKKN